MTAGGSDGAGVTGVASAGAGLDVFVFSETAFADPISRSWGDSRPRSKSRHTSRTMLRPTGLASTAKPLTSALSQITLMVRGNPFEYLVDRRYRIAREELLRLATRHTDASGDI